MQKSLRFVMVVAAAILLAAVLFSPAAQAQSTATRLSALQISLWPEYDQPSVLVIYKLTLASDVGLPANVVVRIPAAAGSPHAVAARQVDNLVNVSYTEQVQGEWNLVSLTATVPELWVEYYDPGLSKDGDVRTFNYLWPGDFSVDNVSVEIQEPVDTSEMTITPDLGSGQVRGNGLTYYTAALGALDQGQELPISLNYTKSGDTLSAEGIEVQPVEPLTNETGGRIRSAVQLPDNFIWMILIGIVGVALIVGGGLWYWRSSQKDEDAPVRRRHAPARVTKTVSEGEPIYCSQCGKRAAEGDRFCRQCGSRLRTS